MAIIISNGYEIIVDDSDIDLVKSKKFYAMKNLTTGYIRVQLYTGKSLASIFFKNLDRDKRIDHINGNALDNRKENLRVCTHRQNTYNRGKMKNNTSGYKGVFIDKGRKRWTGACVVEGKRIKKQFDTKEEAALFYNEIASKYHGEFARLNVLP